MIYNGTLTEMNYKIFEAHYDWRMYDGSEIKHVIYFDR